MGELAEENKRKSEKSETKIKVNAEPKKRSS